VQGRKRDKKIVRRRERKLTYGYVRRVVLPLSGAIPLSGGDYAYFGKSGYSRVIGIIGLAVNPGGGMSKITRPLSWLEKGKSVGLHPDHTVAVQKYYDDSWFDYRVLWLNQKNWSMHFGVWEEDTKTHAESLLNMNRAMARKIGMKAGARVLDAGCGVGGSSLWMAEELDVETVGLTLVEKQVERARRQAEKRKLDHLSTFQLVDYLDSGLSDAQFDAVWALESACYAPDKTNFLTEATRLLRPGGHVVIGDFFRTEKPADDKDAALLERWLSGWVMTDLVTKDGWCTAAADAGLVDAEVEDISELVRPSLRRLYRMSVPLYPGSVLLRFLRIRSEAAQGNIRAAIGQWNAFTRGLWFYGLFSAQKPLA